MHTARIRSLAAGGLVVVLVVLGVLTLLGVARTRDAAEIVARSTTLADAYAYASGVMARNMAERDAAEGIDAFLEKRRPVWAA